jgi:hypothetical protein
LQVNFRQPAVSLPSGDEEPMKRQPRPIPFAESHDNVVSIEGFLRPLRCPRCDGQAISQVDQLEFAYPVAGVRPSRNVIHLDFAENRTGIAATADPFFRCQGCANEWPVAEGTEFIEREGG